MAQFGYAEPHLRVWSFFLRVRATPTTPHGPAWPASCAGTNLASGEPRSDPVRIRPWQSQSIARFASVVRPLGPASPACLSRRERNTDSKRTLASLRGCAAPEAPAPSHPAPRTASGPSHRAVRPCCRNRRKGASMPGRANSAQSRLPDAASNPVATSADQKPRPAHRPSPVPPGIGAVCYRGRTPRRRQPRPQWRPHPRPARSCAAPTQAWWQTRPPQESRPPCGVLDPQPTPAEGKVPGPPVPRLGPSHSREIRRPGCSRCAPPCRYIDASHPPNVDPSSENPSRRRSGQHLDCSTLPQRNGAAYPAQRLHPNEPGPTDAAPDKEPLPPSTPPTASHSCAHSRSTSPVNTPDLAHEARSAQTDPPSSHAPATTHASIPIIASPWQRTKNYIPERIQFITYLQL